MVYIADLETRPNTFEYRTKNSWNCAASISESNQKDSMPGSSRRYAILRSAFTNNLKYEACDVLRTL